jgi:trehalose 6-phosphate synthase/phosphatase
VGKVILVSNRLPVTIRRVRGNGQTLAVSSGGLVSGLAPLHEKGDGVWIGHPGEAPDDKTRQELLDRRLVPVDVPPRLYRAYYEGYSNSAVWPLFHYFVERCEFGQGQFEAYRQVNEIFADTIAEQAEPDDLIWVHDYHLMLLPEMVRNRVPGARIGFFLHIPFPSSETFRVLPQRTRVLRGLLGADLIGVHTYEYADNILRSFRRLLGIEGRQGYVRYSGRTVRTQAHPLGIDTDAMREDAYSLRAQHHLADLKRRIGDRQVVLGVDRLDYTKGLPLKLAAWRRLLADSPRWRQRAMLIQVAIPSRENISSYQAQKDEVERLVGEINGLYGAPGRVPVHYLYQTVSREELGALYRLADVAFVSPVRDGLNLVAKEYVACREDGGGVLVLSEFAGAASELGESLRINPWDVEGTAAQLERALEMDFGERQERMRPMHRRVLQNDVHRWVDRFMGALQEPATVEILVPPQLQSEDLADTIAPQFANSANALLMLDYDGSLREFTERYEDAVPTEEILEVLEQVGRLPGVRLFINSGRDRHTLGEWFSHTPVSLIAEHGSWIRVAGQQRWERMGPPPDLSWKRMARPVLEEYVNRTPGSRVEEKSASMVWHYRQADDALGEWQALELLSVLQDMLSSAPVEIMSGARVIEVRQQGVDKGRAYEYVNERFGPFDFVLATGDDRTDEDIFARLEEDAFSIKVGGGQSRAKTAVGSPGSVRRLLHALVEVRAAVETSAAARA